MRWPWRTRRELVIDDTAMRTLALAWPLLARLSQDETQRLRELMAQFLSNYTLTGAQGLVVTDTMRLQVAAQGCLPVLQLGLQAYDRFSEVILYPCAFEVHRRIETPEGLVSEFDDLLSGEALHGGPVVLSWDDAAPADLAQGAGNLIIHEFAHKLDMAEGEADGCPPMPASRRSHWRQTLQKALQDFTEMVDRIEAAIPANVDPESPEADPWYALLPLDPYAASDSAEFFAVSTEKFFVDPVTLQAEFGELFIQYKRYFGIDPLKWHS